MSRTIDEHITRKLFDLSGRSAIVTGAASGLGEAIAGGLAVFGADVALADVNEPGLAEVAAAIRSVGRQAVPITCDVRVREQVQALVDRALDTFGRVDILVNAAGIARRAPAVELTDTEWDEVVAIDLTGAFLCAQVVGRAMIAQGQGGRIINIASIGAHVGVTSGNANYSAAKGGLVAMSKCLALEWAPHNILVNCISPHALQHAAHPAQHAESRGPGILPVEHPARPARRAAGDRRPGSVPGFRRRQHGDRGDPRR